MAHRQPNISMEPCTLVYTLLDCNALKFDDFFLIIRSLHSYMVDSIVPNPEFKNVHVKLNYQASVANAHAKLGTLQSAVGVTKLSNHVKESEFAHLERLRRQFGIGNGESCSVNEQPTKRKPTRGGRGRVFPQKSAPYLRPVHPPARQQQVEATQPIYTPLSDPEEEQVDDTQREPFYAGFST